ncbi:MAG: hypothetical protein AAB601_00125, partial [Patescibacteria group bacterium]
AISMVLVVGLWLLYARAVIPSLAPAEAAETDGIMSTFGRGVRVLADSVSGEWRKTKEKIVPLFKTIERTVERANQFSVQPTAAPASSSATYPSPAEPNHAPPEIGPLPELIAVTSTPTTTESF